MVARVFTTIFLFASLCACSVHWNRVAAEYGSAKAQNNMGLLYYHGDGVPRNDLEAVRWYRLAAEQGNADAQNNLGSMYRNGYGVTRDYTRAVSWYRLAAEQGHPDAQYNLGVMYENGIGVQRSYFEAEQWYRLAVEQGDPDALKALVRIAEKKTQAPTEDVSQSLNRTRYTRSLPEVIYTDTSLVVALLPLDCPDLRDGATGLLTEIVRNELHKTGLFDVMEREKMTSMLSEVGFAYSSCTSTQCAIEAGQILSVRQMIAGNVGSVGSTYIVSLRVFDVETGRTLATAAQNCRDCAIDDVVELAIPEAVAELAATMARNVRQ